MMKTKLFERMDEPFIHGYCADRVRCYEALDWNVFLTREGHVSARSVPEYRACANGCVSREEAFKIAHLHLQEAI